MAEKMNNSDLFQKQRIFSEPEEIKPDFGRLDSESKEEKESAYREFLGHKYFRDKVDSRLEKICNFLPLKMFFNLCRFIEKHFFKAAGVLVFIFILLLINVMIPRKINTLVISEQKSPVYISVSHPYYDAEQNEINHYSRVYDDASEEYRELLDVMNRYECHGFVNSIFSRSRTMQGPVNYVLVNTENGKGEFILCEDGRFFIDRDGKRYLYYLDWYGKENSRRMFNEILEILAED